MTALLIVGASVRAAARSAQRAGFKPYAVDCFADVDLQRICRVERVEHYPAGLPAAARRHPAVPWMYTGAVENYPDVIRAISQERPLLGNGADVVIRVRDPSQLARCFASHGIPFPETRPGENVPREGHWLCKPYCSGGGHGIRRVSLPTEPLKPCPSSHFWQQYLPGTSLSAVLLADGRHAIPLGATRQLVGEPWTGARPFQYCGSIGPFPVPPDYAAQIRQIADALLKTFPLVGLCGVDMVCHEQSLWPVEINPRYSASIEVIELATTTSFVALHVATCQGQSLPPSVQLSANDVYGKAVLYAPVPLQVPLDFASWADQQQLESSGFAVADIPGPGTPLRAAQPVCTVLARGTSADEVERRLQRALDQVRGQFANWPQA